MIQVLTICHALAGDHAARRADSPGVSVARRPAGGGRAFIDRYRSVNSPTFTNVVVLPVCSDERPRCADVPAVPHRREERHSKICSLRSANGVFEIKEHFAALGLGLLPRNWLFWRQPLAPEFAESRKYVTWMLTLFVWWNFLVGEVLNNIKGLYP